MDAGAYCRAIESYLCRKNDGHLIRIVGPAFELVCGWAATGIPISVVERAIDQTSARYYATGPKRRPVRIEYCEADVLDLFDEWKRAVGVGPAMAEDDQGADDDQPSASPGRQRALAAHLDDVVGRLTGWRATPGRTKELERRVAKTVAELEAARAGAQPLRGEARQRVVTRLGTLDAVLLAGARADADDPLIRRLRSEAERSLEPFRERMQPDVFRHALDVATDRLLVDHFELPRLAYD